MKRTIIKLCQLLPAALCLTTLGSCDEGRIEGESAVETRAGTPARVVADVAGDTRWPDGYSVALAGFADGNEYALISKNVTPDGTGHIDAILDDIPDNTSSVELCVIDRLRRRVATFITTGYAAGDTIRLEGSGIDISQAAAIQKEIFNTTCAQCHGGSGYAAASLHLTEGKSFHDLVDVPSVKEERLRVKPGDSGESVLYRILSTNESAGWNYDHSVEVVANEKLELIRSWIDAGAKY